MLKKKMEPTMTLTGVKVVMRPVCGLGPSGRFLALSKYDLPTLKLICSKKMCVRFVEKLSGGRHFELVPFFCCGALRLIRDRPFWVNMLMGSRNGFFGYRYSMVIVIN